MTANLCHYLPQSVNVGQQIVHISEQFSAFCKKSIVSAGALEIEAGTEAAFLRDDSDVT